MTTSLNDHKVAIEQCHNREAVSSISTIINFSSGRFISPWKIQRSKTCYCVFISFVAHHIAMLCNSGFAVCNFLFAHFAERIGLQAPAESCVASHANYQSLSYKFSAPFIRSIPNIGWMHWLTKHTHQERAKFSS